MAREDRRRFCIDMTQETVARRRILESVCGQMGRKMPTWTQLAKQALDHLERDIIDECLRKGISYDELLAEAMPRSGKNDRKVRKSSQSKYLEDGLK